MNDLISIIVPVYNVLPYIRRCVDSVINQTYKNIEIILVDDGSDDGSELICDQYKEEYPEIVKVIHKNNQGLGAARNSGLDVAKGKYVAMIDSDDWISSDMYESMYRFAEKYAYEIVVCDYFYLDTQYSTMTKVKSIKSDKAKRVSKEDALLNNLICYVPTKLFRSDIIKDNRFPQLVFEDMPFLSDIICSDHSIGYLPEAFYYYEKKAGTLSSDVNCRMLDSIESEELTLLNKTKDDREILLYLIAKRFMSNVHSERKVFVADFTEHIKKFKEEFNNNNYIKNDTFSVEFADYLDEETVPLNIIFSSFGKNDYDKKESICEASWKDKTRNAHFVFLTEDNCDLDTAPESVKRAYKGGDFAFVEDYYKCLYVLNNGGIAVDSSIYFSKPIGQIRMGKSFFGFESESELSSLIFGSQPETKVMKLIVDSYNYNYTSPLSVRIENALVDGFDLKLNGYNQELEENIHVYKFDVLLFDVQNNNNITKKIDAEVEAVKKPEMELVSKEVLSFLNKEKNNIFKQREVLKNSINDMEMRIDYKRVLELESELNHAYTLIAQFENSKSWKVTAPFRKILFKIKNWRKR